VGGTVAVTLRHGSGARVTGELEYDPQRFQSAAARVADADGRAPVPGRVPFDLPPQGQRVIVLRVLPAAAGSTAQFTANSVLANAPDGRALEVRVEGEASVKVAPR